MVITKKVIASRNETRSKPNTNKRAKIPFPKIVMFKNKIS